MVKRCFELGFFEVEEYVEANTEKVLLDYK